jgi:hypothetical protein
MFTAITFYFLERAFKQGVPVIVSNDYPPATGARPLNGFPIHDPLRALCCLHFRVRVSASSMPSWSSMVIGHV